MIANKYISKIGIAVMAIVVCLCFCGVIFHSQLMELAGDAETSVEYETKLFDTGSVISLNILMDENDWNDMLENAAAEEYYQCDVEINGETFRNVGIRPKGNTSLSSIANDPDTDRYSFKLEFDRFVSGQKCFGLDKLVLNNNYADNTNMKEALIYDMYQYIGADAPLYNYAKISVNNEYWGIYLALEAVEDSFLMRNYGAENGNLYKPDGMDMGAGRGNAGRGNAGRGNAGRGGGAENAPAFNPEGERGGMSMPPSGRRRGGMPQMSENGQPPSGDMPQMPEDEQPPSGDMPQMSENGQPPSGDMPQMPENGAAQRDEIPQMPEEGAAPSDDMPQMSENGQLPRDERRRGGRMGGGGAPGGGGMGGSGANLNYSDDSTDSYSTIWDGAVSDINEADKKRVVTALKNISEGTDPERYMDIDNLVKYMAVHIFSVNQDSLSGNMAHNYYLYEYNGMLNIIPWDYNLAMGGMNGGNATSMVNDAIDMPFSATQFFDTLLENEVYSSMYYECLARLTEEYVNGGAFDEFYKRTRSLIDSLVETDPNSFVTYEEYAAAAETLYELVKLRSDSISGQLDGSIPSSESEQKENSESLIDASHIDLNVLGSMHRGDGLRDRMKQFDEGG